MYAQYYLHGNSVRFFDGERLDDQREWPIPTSENWRRHRVFGYKEGDLVLRKVCTSSTSRLRSVRLVLQKEVMRGDSHLAPIWHLFALKSVPSGPLTTRASCLADGLL